MTSTATVLLAASGSAGGLLLLVAAYFTGRHNTAHSSSHHHNAPTASKTGAELAPDSVLQVIEDGVVSVGADGVIRLFNPAAARIAGRNANDATGLDFHNVLQLADEHGKPYGPNEHPFERVLRTNKSLRDNKSLLITASGRQVPVSLIISPLSASEQAGVVGVFRDITHERAEEEERNEFISTASHEMRTPIASIEGYLSLVLNSKTSKVDTASHQLLQKAHTATEHLGQLFQDLLTTTKAEDSRLVNHPEPVDVGQLIAEVIEEIKPSAEKKGLGLHYLTSSGESAQGKVIRPIYTSRVDPERLKEVLRNLIDNAIKYTAAGNITIRLTGDKSVVQMQVTDTGVGIPPDDIPHLFQKFYRVDSSLTREVGGTGLGLFICRKILELYSGRIWVESTLGKGSTFFVNLPRLENTAAIGNTGSPVVKSTRVISISKG